MNIYKISCYSACGTYFASYLQSVTVIAESQEGAIEFAKQWMNDKGEGFIDADPSKWDVVQVASTSKSGVVDWYEDSDY